MANPWERDWNAPEAYGQVDPTYQYEGPQAGANLQNTRSTIQDRAQDNARDDAKFAADLYAKGLRMVNGQIEPIPNWTPPTEIKTPEQLEREKINATSTLSNVLDIIKEAKTLAKQSMTTEWGSLLAPVPGTGAKDLSGKVTTLQANLSFDRLQEMRDASKTGGALGGISGPEMQLLGSTVASLDQGQSQEEFLANLDKIEKHYKRFGLAINGVDPDSEEGKKAIATVDKTNRFIDTTDRGDQYQIGVRENFQTEQDKKFGALAQAAFDRGASAEELRKMAVQYGYDAKNYGPDLEQAIKYRDSGGKGARLTAPQSGYDDPGIISRAINNHGASGLGSFLGGAANGVSLGFMDELQGLTNTAVKGGDLSENIAEANLVKNLQAEANPGLNIAGNFGGGILSALATGGVAGAGAGGARALGADAAFGAAYGAGENNDNRLGGAALGALAGGGGGYVGRKGGEALGSIIGGSGNDSARALYNRGVTLTPGQIRGGAAMQRESRKAGLPGSDVPITQAQERGYKQFNRAAFDEGLETIGEQTTDIGERGVEQAKQAASKGYGFLDNAEFSADKQLQDALASRFAAAEGIPNLGDQTKYSLQRSIGDFISPEGNISGRGFQDINQNLTRRAGKFDKSTEAVGPDAATVLRDAKDDFGDLAARQAPEIMPQLRNANQAYGNVQTLKGAVSKAKNTGGVFTPAQLGMVAESAAKKYGGKHGTTERQFFDLQRAGQDVLPNQVPDSGTAGRAITDGVMNTGKNALRGLNAKLTYNDDVLKMINALAFERPEVMQAVGQEIKKRSRLGGIFGAPALTLPAVN